MKADTLSLKALFQKDVRYVIPTFQRPYVWNQEEQWEPLWDDVRNAAERYLEELQAAGNDKAATAEKNAGTHFMGAVVMKQRLNAAADLETRDVIDGQQRLTTMQLLADAAQQVFEDIGATAPAKRLLRIVQNRDAEGDQMFKLWPTLSDRDAFRVAMTNSLSSEGFEDSPIVQAHDFFRLQIAEWIDSSTDDDETTRRVHGIETVLFALLELVVIDLEPADDAAVIFETLNARGTPLLASDLVKNYVLRAATVAGVDADALHNSTWHRLEDEWWRKEVRQGRIRRPRLDSFLSYWLTMRTGQEVQSHDIFPKFKEYAETTGLSITDVVDDVVAVAAVFRKIESGTVADDLKTFLYRWQVVEAGVAMPVLLWLFSQPAAVLRPEDRMRCLRGLESYLVRRTVCRLTTKDYNRLFLDLLARLQRSGPHEAAVVLIGYLAGQQSDSRWWPDDRQLEAAFVDLPLYRLLTRGRLRMVLEAVEESLRSRFTEDRHVSRGLTIEHVMPRAWEKHWTLPVESEGMPERIERQRLLHSIGNLTLINGKLNTAQSNGPWEAKRTALEKHSVLYLNKALIADFGSGQWDETTIRDRGRAMARQAADIWPSAAIMSTG